MESIKSTTKVLLSCWTMRLIYMMILSLQLQLLAVNTYGQYSKLLDFGSNGGSDPKGSFISVGTDLYGMTNRGGAFDWGTIFKIKPDGSGFLKLLDFEGTSNGSSPNGSLFSDGAFLYGMTQSGGTNNQGTIFKIKLDGSGYSKLLDFDGSGNGSYPHGNLISDGTFLYGMTYSGGEFDSGTIFKIKPDGSSYSLLLEFHFPIDGVYPYGSLTLEGSTLYGMTSSGGVNDLGTVFKIESSGSGFTKLFDFDGNNSGRNPHGSLLSDGAFLYGMTLTGGAFGDGVIFKIMPDGTSFTNLHDFQGSNDGSEPCGDLILEGGLLYGLASYYGNDYGTIFKIKPDGTSFENLRSLNGTTDGDAPYGSLISDGTFLYGMTSAGGSSNLGTVLKIKFDGTEYTKLHDFATTGNSPHGSVISDGTFLYGMTTAGGIYNSGTIFKVLPNGSSYSTLYDFYLDGSNPHGSLLFDGTFLYGMTTNDGANFGGTIFKILPDGTGYSTLLDFDGNNGYRPYGSLISDGTFLYGMTSQGGNDGGQIFKIKPDGTGYVTLSIFDAPGAGAEPLGDLLLEGNMVYGMTKQGGTNGLGTIFKLKADDGTAYTTLLDFNGTNGGNPRGSLISDGTFLYGMTSDQGVAGGRGAIFKIKPDGTGFTQLLDFKTVTDASLPFGSLTYDGTFLYGMTSNEEGNTGSLFQIKTDGTGYSQLFFFNEAQNGYTPYGSILGIGSSLYGMTLMGGVGAGGTLFKYDLNNTCPDVASIAVTDTELTASSGDSYQWFYFGEPISGATTQAITYHILEYGEYAVDITKNGCTATANYNYVITGKEQEPISTIQVFPNPVKENLSIILPQANYALKIIDPLGRVFLEQRGAKGSNELKITNLTPGLYYLIIKSHDDVIVHKVQKQ